MPDPTPKPRDFIQEVPELKRLSEEPRIARALAKSDALALYDALRRWRAAHPDVPEEWVDRLLAQRRFFLQPLRSAPSLMTMNSVGMRLHGREEPGADGTYIATRSVVALFIPICPLAQYLVFDGEKGGWHFLGRVPMSRGKRLWSRVVALATLFVIAAGALGSGLGAWQSAQRASVQLLNGLDIPVRVAVGTKSVTLQPGSHQAIELSPGHYSFAAARRDGSPLEETSLEVPRWTDLIVYNVLGAAPAFLDEVVYQSEASKQKDGARSGGSTALAGKRTYVRDNVNYIFRQPPSSMNRSSGAGPVTYHAFGVATQGWRNALRMLEQEGRIADAAALAAAVVEAEPEEPEARQRAFELALRMGGVESVLALAKSWVDREPENGGAQRLYVDALRGMGRGPEAVAFASERLRALPDSVEFAELLGRAEEPPQALERFRQLSLAHPNVARLHRQYAERLLDAGRFADAVAAFELVGEKDPEQRSRALANHARALALLGKVNEAAALLEAHVDPSAPSWEESVLYGQLARKGAAPGAGDRFFTKLVEDDTDHAAILSARFALEQDMADAARRVSALSEGAPKDALRLRLAASEDPEKAVTLASAIPERALAQLDDPTALLLALEARRLGQTQVANQLERAVAEVRLDRNAAWRYVESGAETERLAEWSLELQAVLHLERARQLERTHRSEAEAVYEKAVAAAPLGGPVSAVLAHRRATKAPFRDTDLDRR